jgi:hypothetical protein
MFWNADMSCPKPKFERPPDIHATAAGAFHGCGIGGVGGILPRQPRRNPQLSTLLNPAKRGFAAYYNYVLLELFA